VKIDETAGSKKSSADQLYLQISWGGSTPGETRNSTADGCKGKVARFSKFWAIAYVSKDDCSADTDSDFGFDPNLESQEGLPSRDPPLD